MFKVRVTQSFKLLNMNDIRQVPHYPTYAYLITQYFKDLTCEEGTNLLFTRELEALHLITTKRHSTNVKGNNCVDEIITIYII